MGDMVSRQADNVVPLGRLRAELAEAKAEKSLPRLQRVIGAATVAAEAQRRVAKLAEGDAQPAEVIQAAREGSTAAATVRLEAETEVGRILAEMSAQGERLTRAEGVSRRQDRQHEIATSSKPSLAELIGGDPDVARANASKWQKIGAIPDEVREEYVKKVKDEGGDPSTAGLLRYANPREPKERTSVEASYDDTVRLLGQLLRYDAVTIASYASNTKRRTQFRKLIEQLRDWADKTDPILT